MCFDLNIGFLNCSHCMNVPLFHIIDILLHVAISIHFCTLLQLIDFLYEILNINR